MRRPCFLCGGEVAELSLERWPLPALGELSIGFGACPGCGLVLQSPAAEPAAMAAFYEETAVHNPAPPDGARLAALERLAEILREDLGSLPASAFQAGSSTGDTLDHLAAAGVARVQGLDPGRRSARRAQERGVPTHWGAIEDYAPEPGSTEPFELVLLTHVLEHLYDPRLALERCRALQREGAWALVEVPLFAHPEYWPPGFLAFEHLNYFTRESLACLLRRAGYEPVRVRVEPTLFAYPVITITARATVPVDAPAPREAAPNRALLEDHLAQERRRWQALDRRLEDVLEAGAGVRIWGCGAHTSLLLARTGLAERQRVLGLVDNSPSKWGKELGGYTCAAPDSLNLGPGDTLVLSSQASEEALWHALAPERERGVRVVRLYEEEAESQGQLAQAPAPR